MAIHLLQIEWDDQTGQCTSKWPPNAVIALGLLDILVEMVHGKVLRPATAQRIVTGDHGGLHFPMLPGGKKYTPHGEGD